MKRFAPVALLLILALALAGCVSVPAAPSYGSVDKNSVQLLANGKAAVVDILSFNDFHGALTEEPKGKSPGIGKMATAILAAKKANPNSILVGAGDLYQGSALSAITKGKVDNEFFKYVGVALSAVGNHEFDWGTTYFGDWSKDGGFPFLAANIYDKATGKPVPWAKPYQVVTIGGHRIAFLGLSTLDTLTTVKQEYVALFTFKSPADSAAEWIPIIQKKEKPELIVVVSHVPSVMDKADATKALGMAANFELDALAKVPGVAAIISGHSHNVVAGYNNGVPVVQAYYNGRDFGDLKIAFDDKGGYKITPTVNEFYKTKDKLAVDPTAQKIYDDNNAKYGADLGNPVATLTADLVHSTSANVTPMGKWVCDLMRSRYNVQIAIQNGGGLRKGFVAGTLKVSDFWDLMPFDNYTITFNVSGKVLKDIIALGIDSKAMGNGQFSGLKVVYDSTKTGADKIVSMTLDNGTPVTDDGSYSMAANDFQFGGGDSYTMIKPNAKNVKETFEPIRDMLLDEAKKAGTITPPSIDGILTKL